MGFPPVMFNKCHNSINKHISDCSGQRALSVDCVSGEGEVYVYACLHRGGGWWVQEEGP